MRRTVPLTSHNSQPSTFLTLVEVGALDQARARSVGGGETRGLVLSGLRVRTGPEGGAGELAPLVHHVEVDVEAGLEPALRVVILPGHRRNAFQGLQRRLLGRLALAHELDDRSGAAGAEVAFA